jgi:hypothetical protein
MDSSNLSNPRYGYSFVVAITQESINLTIKDYLSKLHNPVISVCYIADQNGHEVQTDLASLSTNPFQIPHGTDLNHSDVRKLNDNRFLRGFQAQLGLPPMSQRSKTPDLVQLGSQTSAVTFTLLCSRFTVVEYVEGGRFKPSKWVNISQQKDSPWMFRAKVDMTFTQVSKGEFAGLPPDVQRRIKNITSSAFSVQQLLFDLGNAALAASRPEILNVPKDAYTMLEQTLCGSYFTEMRKTGSPLLACIVKEFPSPTSTLKLTDFNFNVSPYVGSNGKPLQDPDEDQKAASTLNYLCAADGLQLPPAVPFTWNWLDTSQLNDHHGIIAINRENFVTYIQNQLIPHVRRYCIKVIPNVYSQFPYVTYAYNVENLDASTEISFTRSPAGSDVLSSSWNCKCYDETGAGYCYMEIEVDYNVDVKFIAKTIIIEQKQIVRLKVKHEAAWSEARVINQTITDTYTLGVDHNGKATASQDTNIVDQSEGDKVPDFVNFFTGFNELFDSLTNKCKASVTGLKEIDVSIVNNYVFPGGRTFILKDVRFSKNQDLTASATYAKAT